MKRTGNLIQQVADPDNLRLAAWKAAKGKRHTPEVLAWMQLLDLHVFNLREQICRAQVDVGNYRYFKVFEPKERQICASAFGEQVLHHALMNVCHEPFERVQVFDSYACRKGKGTHAALRRAKSFTQRYDWYLKFDIRKFFESISHEVLINQLAQMFKDPAVVSIFEQIVHSYAASPGRGLPIGNLTSQYFANHYLNGLDRFIKEKLRVRAYVRYMDDLVLWAPAKGPLLGARAAIQEYVHQELHAELKPEALNRVRCGLPFLGYHIFPYHVRLLQKSKLRFIWKLRKIEAFWHSGEWPESKCSRHAMPLLAFLEHADAKIFQDNIISRLQGQAP